MSAIQIPSELIDLRDSVKSFIEREIVPIEAKYAQELQETGTIANAEEEKKKIRKRSAELGFYTLHMSEELGGGGLSYLGQILVHEEVSRSGSLLARRGSVLASVEGPTPILAPCTPEQRQRYLDPLMRAEKEMCFALTEPGAGSDATQIKTKAEQKNGSFIISGTKHFITHGAEADFCVVFAVTDPEKRARGGITAFFVDKGTPGFEVARIQRTASTVDRPAELVFDNVEVPAENMLGEFGNGFYAAMGWINGGRLHIAASALGIAQHLLDKMVEYAKTRVAFGHPIGKNQYVQGMVVDSWCELESARSFVYEMASRIDDGADGRREAAAAKLVATEMVGRVADRAIQVYGGNGFMTEMMIEPYWREVRAMRLYEGTSEILRTNIAKTLGL
ncbi:MAG: acyl-CoA dehydrogenase family protein [Actinomycetota bacterium]|nr:acyl-CoA dehydrogenase family protein [Actinomycetota bacterium]